MILALASLAIAALSLATDWLSPRATSDLCLDGLCRFDQLTSSIDREGADTRNLAALLNEDSSNPLVWCTYAEYLAVHGDPEKAARSFEQALALGPGMSPVLMRAANFDFTHGRAIEGLRLSKQLLRQTDAFDDLIFSYFAASGVGVQELLVDAVPSEPRAARSWSRWLLTHGTDEDLRRTWSRMKADQLLDPKTAVDFPWTLWRRNSFHVAREIWSDWSGEGDESKPERLLNRRFERIPDGSPFDWFLTGPSSVEIYRANGLVIRFLGTENLRLASVRQFTTVQPGRYWFTAEVSAEGITTDQGPRFHLFDPLHPKNLNLETALIRGDLPRSLVKLEFEVSPATGAIEVQLERNASERFDNKISGVLHIYEISLRRFP